VQAPIPFHLFLALQTTLLCFVAYRFRNSREPTSIFSAFIYILPFVLLITSTIFGLKWFLRINNHDSDSDDKEVPTYNKPVQYNTSEGLNATTSSFELTSVYYYESLILLAIPIFLASFFIIVLVIIFTWLTYTRYGLRHVNPNDPP
jgi:hypothetical protein